MDHSAISRIFFSDTFAVPSEQTARMMFHLLSHDSAPADRSINAMVTGYVLAALASICMREMQVHLDHEEETVVGSSVQCRHRGPIALGAMITVDGWIVRIADQEATFWVQAGDEHEIIWDGEMRFAVVLRAQIAKKMQFKYEVIGRRELFAAA